MEHRFPTADAHCDFLYSAVQYGKHIMVPSRNQTICHPYMKEGNVALQFFAAWTDTSLRMPCLQQCVTMIDAYHRILEDHSDLFVPFTKDFVPGQGKIATVLTIEGGEAIEGSLAVLRQLYRCGVRAMTLTWNETNELAGAAVRKNRGLTELGRDVIEEMCRIGMAIDVSHASDAAIDDILNLATRPIFASHSNARAVYDTKRALCDEHIRQIAKQGGVVGINFYGKQLAKTPAVCIADIVRHIEHVVKIGGIDCCAIGSDFDGMTEYPVDLKNSSDFPALWKALLQTGFSEKDVRKIAYENLANYIVQFV